MKHAQAYLLAIATAIWGSYAMAQESKEGQNGLEEVCGIVAENARKDIDNVERQTAGMGIKMGSVYCEGAVLVYPINMDFEVGPNQQAWYQYHRHGGHAWEALKESSEYCGFYRYIGLTVVFEYTTKDGVRARNRFEPQDCEGTQ